MRYKIIEKGFRGVFDPDFTLTYQESLGKYIICILYASYNVPTYAALYKDNLHLTTQQAYTFYIAYMAALPLSLGL